MTDQPDYITRNIVIYPYQDAMIRNYAKLHDLNYSQAVRAILGQWKQQNAPKMQAAEQTE